MDEAINFLESLPVPPAPVAHALCVDMQSRTGLRSAVQSLARRGYIGCLPLAHHGRPPSYMVVRLLPGRSPRDCPIAYVFSSSTPRTLSFREHTIAPALQHFVAARLAECATWDHNERTNQAVIEYAESLGSADSARAVLAARPRAAKLKLQFKRCAMLFAAAGELDPLFAAIGAARMYRAEELIEQIRTLGSAVRNSHIVDRVSVGYHTHLKTGKDVSEPAWRIVMGDHVFDLGYMGLNGSSGWKDLNALVCAVRFLREKNARDKRLESPPWRAAQAAVDDPHYNGEMHFDAAREIASADAGGAYALLANAAFYAYQGKKDLRPQILEFALELATANQWQVLAATLQLAQVSARNTSYSFSRAKTARGTRKKS